MAEADRVRRQELAAFLKGLRTSLDPHDFGIARGRTRRVPGLRRDEIASLAGVSVTWYTWLEQGRDVKASHQVVDAIAKALRMDPDQHAYFRHLTDLPDVPPDDAGHLDARLGARRMVADLEPIPACVMDHRSFILSWNPGFARLWGDPGRLRPSQRNVVWMFFTWPIYRHLRNYDDEARLVVARIRNLFGRNLEDDKMRELVTRLASESADFASLWERNEVRRETSRILTLDLHESSLHFRLVYLSILGQEHEHILVFQPVTPSDSAATASR
jgi:transcriptional regulator with XRE-family HTH domain